MKQTAARNNSRVKKLFHKKLFLFEKSRWRFLSEIKRYINKSLFLSKVIVNAYFNNVKQSVFIIFLLLNITYMKLELSSRL